MIISLFNNDTELEAELDSIRGKLASNAQLTTEDVSVIAKHTVEVVPEVNSFCDTGNCLVPEEMMVIAKHELSSIKACYGM